jgi:hypothetical protein
VPDVESSDSRANRANYLSTDNDPLYRFHQWQANLRVLEVTKIKTVPYVPLSHPFVERLIGTLRRECLARTLFWTTIDLEAKLLAFQHYYNEHRTHAGRKGHPPGPGINADRSRANLSCYRGQKHCRGLYQTRLQRDFSNWPPTGETGNFRMARSSGGYPASFVQSSRGRQFCQLLGPHERA